MTTATIGTNGRPARKQLSDQLDRLDQIIDLLADGLPGAVADACREGARLAVKDAVREILTDPTLRQLLVPPAPPAPTPVPDPQPVPLPTEPATPSPPPRPGAWTRFSSRVAAARAAAVAAVAGAVAAVTARCHAVRDAVAAVGAAAGERVPVKEMTLVAAGVGTVVGVACLVVPQTASAVVSGASAAATAVAVQAGCWVRRAARRFGLVG